MSKVRAMPFRVNRASRLTLVAQVVEGLKAAILGGYYRVGDVLPSRYELADALGVSARVTREALIELARSGLVNPRQRVGTVVLGSGVTLQRGRVLFIWMSYDESTYFATRLVGELRKQMMREGYAFRVLAVPASSAEDADLSVFDGLTEGSAELAIVFSATSAVVRRVDALGIPFVTIGGANAATRNQVCRARINFNAAVPEFVRLCRESGVKRVFQAGCVKTDLNAARALKRAGIAVEARTVSPPAIYHTHEEQVRAAKDAILKAFSNRKAKLPDVILFVDDYVAYGGLLALAYAQISIPRDVRVVTLSNRGAAPVANVSLTRFEFDFSAYGEVVARHALARLRGEPVPTALELSPVYVAGESFP